MRRLFIIALLIGLAAQASQSSGADLLLALKNAFPSGQTWSISEQNNSKIIAAPAGQFWDLSEFSSIAIFAGRPANARPVRLRWIVHSRAGGRYQSNQPMLAPAVGSAAITLGLD